MRSRIRLMSPKEEKTSTHRKSWTFKGNKGLSDDKLRKLGTYYQQILKRTTLSVSQKVILIKAILQHHLEFPNSRKNYHADCYMIGNAGCPWRKAYEEKALGKKVQNSR